MEPTVLSLLTDTKYHNFALHITGYGSGGSIASISLPYWYNSLKEKKLRNKMQVFMYSSPRPGSLEYSKYLETLKVPLVRYAKKGDIVPHVPDQSMGYSHAGLEFYDVSLPFIRKNLVRCSATRVEDNKCSLRDQIFIPTNHITPFQKPIPLPPYC
ncbi:hypothetical protein DSO57_1035496 [Entomophthora muscae]|uniref:Uncharacterized protein n=1 Tax=Entomophthora muscae TaxID=34485 RepID=A0ACC2TAC7_9FUNG|nr:hypothetical protein DSO57_1035496 [Entomophthora muscae]